ncbi:hypothetical protein ACR9LK_07035 [Helicobacter pylori]|uniref:hypothetical protein n=1 Tax=Helicobacter pylori TaxID=210 RepID=UPI0009A3AAC2|nr:hypothetical protein [Helicobacter pylori]
MTPLIKNLNSSSLARISFYSIKSNQLLMEEILTLIFNPYPLNFEKRVFKFAERVFSLSIARKPLQYPRL